MRTGTTFVVLASLVAASACRKVEPAPEDLDGQFHWFWDHGFSAESEDIDEGIALMRDAVEADAAEEILRGSVSDLLDDQVEGYAPEGQLAEEAAGFYLVNTFDCTLEQLEPVLYELDQASQYLDIYERYDRVYTSDFQPYLDREVDVLTWDIDLDASILGANYREVLSGGIRYIPATDTTPGAIVQRTWLTAPAEFREGSNKTFEQDYQLEVYIEVEPGRMLHAYAIWRDIFLGAGLTADDGIVVNTTLNNLEDWDDRTEELCAGEE